MMKNQSIIYPEKTEMWQILNCGHIGLPKVGEELLDNCLSAGAKKILLQIVQEDRESYRMIIEDTGCGMAREELSRVFALGNAPGQSDRKSGLNQFHVGLKSALASCDPDNDSWVLYSRTREDAPYIRVSAPYSLSGIRCFDVDAAEEPWPGRFSGSGTLISVPLNQTLLNSCDLEARTNRERIEALVEDLQVTYAKLLTGVEFRLEWSPLGEETVSYHITPKRPRWSERLVTGKEILNLDPEGTQKLSMEYAFGRIIPYEDGIHYYKGNISTSGLMVYVHGRLVQSNLFQEVWGKPHPQFNSFLFEVNLEAVDGDLDALPSPTPDKDQMVLSDPAFQRVLKEIHKICPSPRRFTQVVKRKEEMVRREQLMDRLEKQFGVRPVDAELPVPVGEKRGAMRSDLYYRKPDGTSVLYELKVGRSGRGALDQLSSYALHYMEQGLELDELVLVADEHPDYMEELCSTRRRRWYRDLPVPVIRLVTWEEVEQGVA